MCEKFYTDSITGQIVRKPVGHCLKCSKSYAKFSCIYKHKTKLGHWIRCGYVGSAVKSHLKKNVESELDQERVEELRMLIETAEKLDKVEWKEPPKNLEVSGIDSLLHLFD